MKGLTPFLEIFGTFLIYLQNWILVSNFISGSLYTKFLLHTKKMTAIVKLQFSNFMQIFVTCREIRSYAQSQILRQHAALKPTHRIIETFLGFRTIWRTRPPPSLIKFRYLLIWKHIDGGRPPFTDILNSISKHIYIGNGQIKCSYF